MPQVAFLLTLCHNARRAACLWTFTFCTAAMAAQPSTVIDFNGPDTIWQVADDNRAGRVLLHECTAGGARDAAGIERIVVAAPGGDSVQLVCPTAPVVVIEELAIRIWVKANSPNIQLAARIALPRTANDSSPSATQVMVRGDRYQRPGNWQQLVLRSVPSQLEQQVRIRRSTSEATIDAREAFVDAVVLIVPGEPQGVEIATDDLVVDGVERSAPNDIQQTSYPAAAGGAQTGAATTRTVPANLRRLPNRVDVETPSSETTTVRLHGEVLLVNDRPFLPRIIQYQGEPLQTLAERGFNVAWLDRAPTAEEAATARKFNLWFIGAPPRPETLTRDVFGRPDDRVIAWYLADEAMESNANYASRWADLVRERDAVRDRPVILAPHDNWVAGSKSADVLLAARPGLEMLSSAEYEVWLAGRMPLVRPGLPLWACFPSQLGPAVGKQISVLSGGAATASPNIPTGELQLLVEVLYSRGVRGFAFHSHTSLSETDATTRARAIGLELINRRLQRLEPWLASGKVYGQFPSADGSWIGIVLSVERARLLIPVANTVSRVSAASTREEATFVVPGVPDSCQVYVLTPVAVKTLPTQRIAGGTRFTLRPDDDAFVLLTEDPKVVQSLRQHMTRYGERVVRLLRESAALKAAAIAETSRSLAQSGINSDAAARSAAGSAAILQQVDAALASQRIEQAFQAAVAANQTLELSAAEMRRVVRTVSPYYSNPLALGDETLAEFASFERARSSFQFDENLLYGGDFEDVGQLTQIGWQHFQNAAPGVESQAELSIAEPRHGSYCLKLQAAASGEARPVADAVSVWIESPSIPVPSGQVLEISGWARVDPGHVGDGGGLQIFDSVGGAELALAIPRTNGWERFQIIRAIPEATELRLTFGLMGIGTAQLDAVMVRPVKLPPTRLLPALTPVNNASVNTAPSATGPRFIAPGGSP